MSIFVRIWFFFGLVLLLGFALLLQVTQEQVKPNVRQVVEDTLAENATIMARLVAQDVFEHKVDDPQFNDMIQSALQRDLNAKIWTQTKRVVSQRLYITDAQGIVLYDSSARDTGQDYSKWNDVYLTLKGQYGARSTNENPYQQPKNSVMYVAAPIIYRDQLIGVLSLGKPNSSVEPYIWQAQNIMLQRGLWMLAITLFLSSIVAWWLRHSIEKVRRYADALAPVAQAPHFLSARELNQLTAAISDMRERIEDHAYVERYINTLTHELKSPLTAIQASAELLQDDLPFDDQQHFAQNIEKQTSRLKALVDNMLLLTRLEKKQYAFDSSTVHLAQLLEHSIDDRQSQIQQQQLTLHLDLDQSLKLKGDRFWLTQAFGNILDNALAFVPDQGLISIRLWQEGQQICITCFNQGPFIPDYAFDHLFEHYYSLPRTNGQKSTGIGLTLVKEVLDHHQASIQLRNVLANQLDGGVSHHDGVLCEVKFHLHFT